MGDGAAKAAMLEGSRNTEAWPAVVSNLKTVVEVQDEEREEYLRLEDDCKKRAGEVRT